MSALVEMERPQKAAAVAASLVGVTHHYGETVALNSVTLEIPGGCMAGLIGPDGVGKSTLLGLIAGVRKIQTGEVRALDGDLKDAAFRQGAYARIAYMPQGLGRNLYPTLSVFENLDFIGRLFAQGEGERKARIDDLTRSTGLDPFLSRPAGKLSGGMKQKLSLCCSLIHDPDLLILDEPTTGVDPLSRRQFWELIDRIRGQRPQMSVAVATAYMEEADQYAWLAAMDGGRVIATGSPAEIKKRAGVQDLEAAFIALLPEEKRKGHKAVEIPPRKQEAGPPAIEADGLTKRFDKFVAVDHVSFRIEKGEIFGFLGSNGCGKSTTMKMLTGLLPATEGKAMLFGHPVGGEDMEMRRRVGYMSQAFSLYGELTVRKNLELHAKLFDLPLAERGKRVDEMLDRFGLKEIADVEPESLPLGIRQRLQLAVAIQHRPEMLILDEPTSGVDPVARDQFWEYLIALSRNDGVTIFLSTHFMNEAMRCDRISLMHSGKVLAAGTPPELIGARHAKSLEEAFIGFLEDASGVARKGEKPAEPEPAPQTKVFSPPKSIHGGFSISRLWAYARREAVEIMRDPVRIAFALFNPIILMFAIGYGISFDVEHLRWAVFDQDRSLESRQFLDSFQSPKYFDRKPDIRSADQIGSGLRSGELKFAVEVPTNFGHNLITQQMPEIGVWISGDMPFRAETTRSYLGGVMQSYLADLAARLTGKPSSFSLINVEERYRYNQSFKSIYSEVPSTIMVMLILIPAIMTALGVVREVETGSIANFRSTPVTRVEFLLGKQLPYVLIGVLSFATLVLLAIFVFGVPVRGSWAALIAGGLLCVCAATGFGLLMSTLVRTQVAAVFGTTCIALIPTVSFSGLLVPVSSLSGAGRAIGLGFPSSWFQQISVGTFTKGLGFPELWLNHLALAIFAVLYIGAAALILRKQEILKVLRKLFHILALGLKELNSIRADPILLALTIYTFSYAVYAVATGAKTEVDHVSTAIVDEDRSELSRLIRQAILPPWFQPPVEIPATEIGPSMDASRYVFVIEIPPKFEQDVISNRYPSLQINMDATAVAQAGNGGADLQQIINQVVQTYATRAAGAPTTPSGTEIQPVNLALRVMFNPNLKSEWFTSVMQVINNITMLSIILTGAALIREREHGTIEHLLAMPVTPSEIMLSKIWANGLVILVAAILSVKLVVQLWLQVPIAGSLVLFLAGAVVYAFSVTSMGILLATFTTSMGQFGLLVIPVLVILQMLSGSATPMETMPVWLQGAMQIFPTPHFVSFSQAVLYRAAGIDVVWPELLVMAIISAVYFVISGVRFRKTLVVLQ